jgi:Tubulin like
MNNKLYIIAIGGSGAKCVESIVQIAATGLYTKEEIEVLFVDPDENNGNVDRARKTLSTYQACQKLVTGGSTEQQIEWMSTPIKSHDLWSPFQGKLGGRELASYFNYGTMDAGLANLLEVLYTPDERNQQLDEGFRGRPAIGAAVMSQIDLKRLDTEPWGSLIQSINNAVGAQGKQARVLLCGSIFGGTGASGIPTIARLLRNKLEQQGIADRVKLGGLFLLPYFSFTVPPGAETNGLYAASDQFLLNTESALRYYVTQASELFDTVYLLGNENTSEVEFSVGNTTQKNRPHFVELYAALAARDFLIEDRDDALMSITRDKVGEIKWSDLPDDFTVKKLMTNAARLAYLWTTDIEKIAQYTRANGLGVAARPEPWLTQYYDLVADSTDKFDLPQQQKAIETLGNWSRSYMQWLQELHVDKIDRLQLFNTQIFGDLNGGIQFDKLSELLLGDTREPRTKQDKDNIVGIKERLRRHDVKSVQGINRGTVGLAKSLYLNSQFN